MKKNSVLRNLSHDIMTPTKDLLKMVIERIGSSKMANTPKYSKAKWPPQVI
ncbi:hypothetical protein ACFY5J_02400 [Peribacillus butanolivorans]|uniref:hypothetical protein n=1 Tax=Peribacillus butanolivorans TaxID=421767 RepID=UPI0036974FDF